MESSIQKEDGALQKARQEAEKRWAYWGDCQSNKTPASLGNGKTQLSKYLQLDTWTPEQAACLVSGFKPESFSYARARPNDIAYQEADSLSGMRLMGGRACIIGARIEFLYEGIYAFENRKRVLELWDSRENPPAKVRPADFVAWCKTKNIDASWLAEIENAQPETNPMHAKTPDDSINQELQPDADLAAAATITSRFIESVIVDMEKGNAKITVSTIWNKLLTLTGKSIIEDTKPDALLCNVGEDDLYHLKRGAVKGVLQRRRARQRHA